MSSLATVAGAARLSGAISVNTVYYVPDLAESLLGLRRALTAQGQLVIGLGDPAYMATLPFAGELILRPLGAIIELLAGAGFTVTDHVRTSNDPRAFHLLSSTVADAPQ